MGDVFVLPFPRTLTPKHTHDKHGICLLADLFQTLDLTFYPDLHNYSLNKGLRALLCWVTCSIALSSNPRAPFSPREVLTWSKSGCQPVGDPRASEPALSRVAAVCPIKQSHHFTCIFLPIAIYLSLNVPMELT